MFSNAHTNHAKHFSLPSTAVTFYGMANHKEVSIALLLWFR